MKGFVCLCLCFDCERRGAADQEGERYEREMRKKRGGGVANLWEELNYKFAPKISCDKLPLNP